MQTHVTTEDIQAGLAEMGGSPRDIGRLEMIVRRPGVDERQVLEQAELSLADGLAGDTWRQRGSSHTPDGSARLEAQITLVNSRIIQLLARDRSRWPLAGDQLFVDFDLSSDNLRPGQRLVIGTAILEVSDLPHTGCDKFTARFGSAATHFVNSAEGQHLRRRGLNTRVVQPGAIRVGDTISKIDAV
jgi:MOSC domain-containing protein YiiM